MKSAFFTHVDIIEFNNKLVSDRVKILYDKILKKNKKLTKNTIKIIPVIRCQIENTDVNCPE